MMKTAINPKAVNVGDMYMVVNRRENRAVESHGSREKALRAASILNGHETNHGRPAVFAVLCLRTGSVVLEAVK